MSKIKCLGYIGCEVTDFNAWDSLLDTVYGLEKRDRQREISPAIPHGR